MPAKPASTPVQQQTAAAFGVDTGARSTHEIRPRNAVGQVGRARDNGPRRSGERAVLDTHGFELVRHPPRDGLGRPRPRWPRSTTASDGHGPRSHRRRARIHLRPHRAPRRRGRACGTRVRSRATACTRLHALVRPQAPAQLLLRTKADPLLNGASPSSVWGRSARRSRPIPSPSRTPAGIRESDLIRQPHLARGAWGPGRSPGRQQRFYWFPHMTPARRCSSRCTTRDRRRARFTRTRVRLPTQGHARTSARESCEVRMFVFS